MRLLNNIFTGIVCGALLTNGAMAGDDCLNLAYKQSHPERCKYTFASNGTSTFLTIGAGIAAAGAALVALAGGNDASGASNAYTPITYNGIVRTSVGGDVSAAELTETIAANTYNINTKEFSDIQLAYSLARGYTGKNTKIAVMDTAMGTFKNERGHTEIQHAQYVMEAVSGPIAPDATIEHHAVAYNKNNFMTYDEIGDVFASTDADIYNSSWNAPYGADKFVGKSREYFMQVGGISQNFMDAISDIATHTDGILVWAAGNDSNAQSGMFSALPIVMPELSGHFVNVVAWDSNASALADYSNACGVTKNYCITAPVTITRPNGEVRAGTSFAAPVVSAAIAVIHEAWNYIDSATIVQILFDTATDLGQAGVDDVYGHGMLDLEAATRPVGTPTIMISDTVAQPLQVARASAQIAQSIKSANPTMAFFDKYGREFETNVADNISVQNRGLGFERLRGDDARMKISMGDMEFGFYRNDMLSGTGFLQTSGDTTTTYIATNKSYDFGKFELFGRTQMGVASPRASNESVISSFSNIYTASAYVGVRGDKWSFSVGVPDTIVNGTMNLHLANGRDTSGAIVYNDYTINMATQPAIEYTANWRFLTAGFVDNPYGNDEFYVFAKTKLSF